MFYSRQLLARKAPLGQIWIAATTHAKISRRNLDKLNIIRICEEILNPSVPMALRLSGILMGGVVIVYERKVKLLYDDVTRLLVELNEPWKVKAGAGSHSINLPPRRFRAKYEDITLPNNVDEDAQEDEGFYNFSNTATFTGLRQGDYICVSLDNVEEVYLGNTGEDVMQDNHQADAENITLWEPSNLCDTDMNLQNYSERFHEDGVIQLDSEPAEQVPVTPLIPSPPHQNQHQKGDPGSKIQDPHQENQINQEPEDRNEANQPEQNKPRNEQNRKRGKRPATFVMDYEKLVIPGNVYQSWLQDASDVVSRRGKKTKQNHLAKALNIGSLMKLPPTVLTNGILTTGLRETNYPAPLLELWMTSMQVPHDSSSGRNSKPQPPKPSSPSNRVHHQDPTRLPIEDSSTGVGSTSIGVSIEKRRGINDHNEPEFGVLLSSLRQEFINDNARTTEVVIAQGSSGGTTSNDVRSFPGSDSGHGPQSQTFEPSSGRINRKRPCPWSRHSGSSLEPVDEEYGINWFDANFELTKVSEKGVTPENELIVETEPTQTQRPFIPHPMEKTTDSIRMHLKTHFETPGAPQTESLDRLASGMDRPKAAKLFYQTCVLASCGSINVEQKEPYGDILISRGEKM